MPLSLRRSLLFAGLAALAMASTACTSTVGVGVGYGYPGSWSGVPVWTGGYIGGPTYR
jgi:hypothetical protein